MMLMYTIIRWIYLHKNNRKHENFLHSVEGVKEKVKEQVSYYMNGSEYSTVWIFFGRLEVAIIL